MGEIMNKTESLIADGIMAIKKYEWVEHNNPSFNIIEILSNISDEVNLHSKLIVSILCEKKEITTKILELFLKSIGINDFDISSVEILREYKNIDILIRNNKKCIIIENKIYALDQPKQLERYYNTMVNEGYRDEDIHIYYLTLDGREPTSQSAGFLSSERVKTISYENNILQWIELSIEKTALLPSYRETFNQYGKVVRKLIGKRESSLMNELHDVISKSKESMVSASVISEAFNEIKPHIQYKFWQTLEEKLNKLEYEFENELKYSFQAVQNYYTKSRNNKYFGLLSEVYRIDETHSLYLYIEIDHTIYWGYTVADANFNRNINMKEEFKLLLEKFNKTFPSNENLLSDKILRFDANNYFIGGFEFIDDRWNFYQFSNDNILKLVDETYLEKEVDKIAQLIDKTTKMMLDSLTKP
jgi:hypothetical protein